ncbi:hypothetical protein [Rariglobus hedericola]|uniref:Verru_Chthon cassette protein A n=1 Tax=Rariglobus hedericola TaxID=2597822 RepID=A0A556QPG0_9BACT|nr:hypothetical protein [Rariglobus hedericola]TSJ78530.1 hypothetical protein FPL22_04315 [Rariglobus hedericola]
MSLPPAAPFPSGHTVTRKRGQQGFALLITITLLSFLVLLLVSLASLTRVETQVASNSIQLAQARQNALMGLQIALGELQKHAGPDQRVTAPATAVYPKKDVTTATGELFDKYRARAVTAAHNTYLTPAERINWETDLRAWWNTGNRNPYWTAVFDSSLRRDGQTSSSQYGEPKRNQLPVWLVSGNERLGFNPRIDTTYPTGYFTPDVDVATLAPTADDIIKLVDKTGPAAADSVDGMSGRVQVVRQPVSDPSNNTLGHYAYWVADESTKANFSVRDPYFNNNDPTSVDYRNRLQVPQRVGWERITGFDTSGSTVALNDPVFEKALVHQQLQLIDPNFTAPVKNNFHHLTTYSRSILTDTVIGGLKKDLTVFFEGTGAGINPTDPIFDRSLYASNDPRFGTSNAGFPKIASATNIPTWGEAKEWFDSTATGFAGTVPVTRGRAPILANFQVFYAFTHENGVIQMHMLPCVVLWNPFDAGLSSTTYRLKWRHNFAYANFGVATQGMADPTPADATDGTAITDSSNVKHLVHKLQGMDWFDGSASNFKTFYANFSAANPWSSITGPAYRFAPFDRGPSAAANAYAPAPSDPNSTWVTYEFTTSFEAGQAKIFTVGSSQKVSASDLHAGTQVVQLLNDFVPDFPASYYFDVARIVDPSGTGTATPSSSNTVRVYATQSPIASPTVMSMQLSTKGGDLLWRNEYNGNPGNPAHSVRTNPGMVYDQPSTWRLLRDRHQWEITPKGTVSSGDPASAVIGITRGRLEPFSVSQSSFYGSSQGTRMQASTLFVRAFSLYNIAAPSLDLNTKLEGSRAGASTNNTDKFSLLQLMRGESGEKAAWDIDQSQVTGADTEGFALISWTISNGLNNDGLNRLPLRQVKRASARLLSLGQLQQANLSPLAWEPAFPVGNSEASPYVDRARIAGIESYPVGSATSSTFSADTTYYRPQGILPNDSQNRGLDNSYLLNESLWDGYFLSSIPQSGSLELDNSQPLPNSRHRFSNTNGLTTGDVRDFNTGAAYLTNIGALNVNSTSVEAWKALLIAFRGLSYASDDRTGAAVAAAIPISRTLDPLGGNVEFTFSGKNNASIAAVSTHRNYTKLFTGFRYLTDSMIQALAERIVDEVRLRGPFYSLGDFINRRLVAPEGAYTSGSTWQTARTSNQNPAYATDGVHTYGNGGGSAYNSFVGLAGLNGALQRAINVSGINGGINYPISPVDNNDRVFRFELDPTKLNNATNIPMEVLPQVGHYLDTEHLAGAPIGEAGSLMSHAPGFVTQADILSMIGPALTARGDTFLIRTYGDTLNPATGEVTGRAWLEAVVQRTVTPVTPAAVTGADRFKPNDAFGRRFVVVSMRWLSPEDL